MYNCAIMGKNKLDQVCIRQIALEAGVSTATVSRVFNRYEHVSEAVRTRVMTVARRAGYAPRIASTRILFGILVGRCGGYVIESYTGQMLHSISQALFTMGYNVQIFSHDMFPYILRNTFRGVFVFSARDAAFFRRAQIPCMVINDPAPGVCNVATDHSESLKIAVEYLLERGHRKIAYLHSASGSWGARERLKGYHETMRNAGILEEAHLCEGFLHAETDIPEKIRLLITRKPTAMIVEGEARGLLADCTLKHLGIRIPEDLSLIAFENPLTSSYLTPAHTTICQDFEKLGRSAAEIMAGYVLNPPKKRRIPDIRIFHNHLIERDSCAEAPH